MSMQQEAAAYAQSMQGLTHIKLLAKLAEVHEVLKMKERHIKKVCTPICVHPAGYECKTLLWS